LLSGIFLFLQVFVVPHTPILASGDEAIYLHHATRMLHGELIYRDYDHFTFPGTDVLYTLLFRVFGVRMWIPDAMLIVLGTCLLWLTASVSRKVLNGPISLLPALLFICLPFSSYLDATHHWYSTVAVTAALLILLEQRTVSRLICAGVLMGIATFFTQSMILVMVGLFAYLIWERHRELAPWRALLRKQTALLASFFVTISLCLSYFVAAVGVNRFLYFTVVFVAKYYPADWFNNWRAYMTGRPHFHEAASWIDIPAFGLIHLVVPWIYVFFSVWLARHILPEELRKRLMLINITGISLFLTVASAPGYIRLYVVSAPALILLVYFVHSWQRSPKLTPLLWAIVLVMALARPVFTQLRHKTYLDLPTGRTAFFEPLLYEKCRWMSEHSHPGDYFFGDHLVAFALGLRNPGRVPFLRPTDYTRPEEVTDTITKLEKFQVKYVLSYSDLNPENQAYKPAGGDHLDPMRAYLRQNYRPAVTFSNRDQIWERDQ
jgi:hypothetical protein